MVNRITLLAASLTSLVSADVRTCTAPGTYAPADDKSYLACEKAESVPGFKVPHTFGYYGIEKQRRRNYDTYIRSNCDNEANRRNEKREAAQDMLPCRQPFEAMDVIKLERGKEMDFPVRWNNPHDSSCEFNIWTGDMTKTCAARKPFNCGGGYKNQLYKYKIPNDTPGCSTPEERCFLQFYGHSVETRTYAICTRFYLVGEAAAPAAPAERRLTNDPNAVRKLRSAAADPNTYVFDYTLDNPTLDTFETAVGSTESEESCVMKPAIHYWDSFDTSHKDEDLFCLSRSTTE